MLCHNVNGHNPASACLGIRLELKAVNAHISRKHVGHTPVKHQRPTPSEIRDLMRRA